MLLTAITTAGGGRFCYVEQAAQIPDFLQGELGEALEVTVRGVTLHLRPSAGVSIELLSHFDARDVDGGRDLTFASAQATLRWTSADDAATCPASPGTTTTRPPADCSAAACDTQCRIRGRPTETQVELARGCFYLAARLAVRSAALPG